jgi:hypothetical protein
VEYVGALTDRDAFTHDLVEVIDVVTGPAEAMTVEAVAVCFHRHRLAALARDDAPPDGAVEVDQRSGRIRGSAPTTETAR